MTAEQFPNIRLRAMEPEDLDFLYRIENDITLWDIGVTNVPYSRYLLHDFISHSSGDIYSDRQVRLIVEDVTIGTVGVADLMNFSPSHLRAEVGIVIEQPFRRRGYASAAISLLNEYAARTLHMNQLYAIVCSANKPAFELFGKMGYRKTAILPEWLFDGKSYSDAVIMQMKL